MPSIAQQDYLKISCQGTRDCHLLAALAHNFKQGTLFDTVISIITGDGPTFFTRPDAYGVGQMDNVEVALVYFKDPSNPDFEKVQMLYTQTQYEGLAAIQDAENDYSVIPALQKYTSDSGVENCLSLQGDDTCVCVDGKLIVVTTSDEDTIAALAISDESPAEGEAFINISWEDAQKLIGLPIA